MGSRQEKCATCVIKRWRPSIISSLHAPTHARYGTASYKCCTDRFHSSPQQPSAGGSVFEQDAPNCSGPAWTPCSPSCLGMCGKSATQDAFAGLRLRRLSFCSSSRKKGIDGFRLERKALEALLGVSHGRSSPDVVCCYVTM